MDSSQQEKIAELRRDLEHLKEMVSALERKIGELYSVSDGQDDAEHIELVREDFLSDISDVPESIAPDVPEPEPEPDAETPSEEYDSREPVDAGVEVTDENSHDEDAESLFGELVREKPSSAVRQARTLNDVNAARAKKSISDARPERPAWQTDMPGPEVKDVRSAISLNDRVMFISTLFREDSMLFQDVVNRINSSATLDKAVDYLSATFPEWDMYSEPVYRFMMAVRRKIR